MRVQRSFLALLTAVLGLALLLGFEISRPALSGHAMAPRLGTVEPAVGATPAPLNRAIAAWQKPILARPLFSPSRRPARSTAGAGAQASAGLPRLSGIIIAHGQAEAIFAPATGQAMLLKAGGRIGDYTVVSVGADGVVVSGPDGRQTVQPRFVGTDSKVSPAPEPRQSAGPERPPAAVAATPAPAMPTDAFIQNAIRQQLHLQKKLDEGK